jgi:predicted ATPase
MTSNIDHLEIIGLYGRRDYLVTLENNQLILVGENGTGKSTIISIFYFVITGQWKKLWKFDFERISISVDKKIYNITREDTSQLVDIEHSSSKTQYIVHKLREMGLDPEDALAEFSRHIHRELAGDLHMPPMALRRILTELSENQGNLFDNTPSNIDEFQDKVNFHVLYLPTYRRIERDLKALFPTLEDDIQKYNRNRNNFSDFRKHVELVEFGMQDVSSMISRTMKAIDYQFRASLDDLTGGYLRVILRKEYENTDVSILNAIDEDALDDILQKIDKSVLSEIDQKTLRETIRKFGDRDPKSEIDKLSAHIITKLILLHKTQYERESRVREFANVCNRYLKGKAFEFDNKEFSLPIKPLGESDGSLMSSDDEIKLSMLSSGEKQIVSLFSHLYLSDHNDFFIIIDEPELSLSVPWQKTFLTDMLGSSKVKGMVAVTHSPFIYANELEDKAHSIQEFTIGKQ